MAPPTVDDSRKRRGRVALWFGRLSLRTRLIGAFLVLIVTSASATIAIGNLVFGQKVVELATSNMEVGLKVMELSLAMRLERLQLLARMEAHRFARPPASAPDESEGPHGVCHGVLPGEDVLDLAVLLAPGGNDEAVVYRLGDHEATNGHPGTRRGGPGPWRCARVPISAESPVIAELARKTSGGSTVGTIYLGYEEMAALGYEAPPPEGLFIAASASLEGGGRLVLVAMLNGRTHLVAGPMNYLWPERSEWYEATLFLRDQRVATTMGARGLGTRVDPVVVRSVLHEGRGYAGIATVVDETFYAAYMPLRDFAGGPTGILGIGVREAVYIEMRNRTVTLFAGLIALGMIFGVIMTYVFSRWLIRPIAALAKGVNRVASGDLSYKVRIASRDELGRLARAFNKMVRAIKQRDIRLRDMTEERLSHVEKQVSVGRLAAGVAHEINNPLTSILSLSMLLRAEAKHDDPRYEDLDIIVEETTRCREIVRNLLDFARETPSVKQTIDIGQLIRETLVLTRRYEAMDRVRTELELSEAPLRVLADAKQLQQVITNVVTNAAEALDGEGAIVISTDEDSSGGFVVVRVRDDGCGMSPEDIKRAFEPFFTTKGERRGTGLGLSVSLGIIQKHEGSIDIESRPGEGTTVTISLPLHESDWHTEES